MKTSHKNLMLAAIVLGSIAGSGIGIAQASDKCNVAEADRRPIEELQAQLEADGWTIRKMKVDDGCYEAYAIKADGTKVEAYFDPQTFDMVSSEED